MSTSRFRRSAAAVLAMAAATTTVLVGQATASEDRPATATASSQSPAPADAVANPERIPRIASAWHAAWTGDDPNALADLFTKTGTLTDLAVPYTSEGREEIAEFKATTDRLIPDADLEITHAFRSGNSVVIQTDYSGTLPGAPKSFKVQMATILELRHGLIATDTDYYDKASMLRQSGLPSDWKAPPQS